MARPSLPTLTWKKSVVTSVANATPDLMLAAIETLITGANFWIVDADGLSGNPAYLSIRPRLTTDSPASPADVLVHQRIALATEPFTASSMTLTHDNNASARQAQPDAEAIVLNYTPPDGAPGTISNIDQNNPWPSASRNIGWLWTAHKLNGSRDWKVWLIESSEVLSVIMENVTDSEVVGFIAGATIVGASNAAADIDATGSPTPAGDRIYSVMACAKHAMSDSSHGDRHTFPGGHYLNNAYPAQAVVHLCFDPALPAQTLQVSKFPLDDTEDGDGRRLTSGSGAFVGIDIHMWADLNIGTNEVWSDGGSERYLGLLRQMKICREFPSRVVIESGGAPVAIVLGADPSTNQAAIAFTNS